MTDLTVVTTDEPQPERSLSRLMPRNVKELAFFGNQAAASGLFKTGNRNITGTEAFLLMSQGIELGLSPLQSLRELNIINGRVDVPASVRAALICNSPKVTQWDAVTSSQECTITAKRSDRTTVCSVTVKKSDMNPEDVKRHTTHMDDWLYARAVRKISRRYFPDFALGLGTLSDDYDPEKIIDVGRVEQAIDVSAKAAPYGYHDGIGTDSTQTCGGILELHANTKTGGAFLRCPKCNAAFPPPQEVRDVIRNSPPALTIAATDRHSPEADDRGDGAASTSDRSNSLPDPEPDPPSGPTDEPPVDAPVDAAENTGGSLPDTPEAAAEPPRDSHEPEPAADAIAVSDSGSQPTIDATAPQIAADAPEAVAAPLSPRDALRAFLRTNRAARGPLHVAIRDALLDAGWDGTTGISQLCDDMSDDSVQTLLETFARPGFGSVQ